MINDYIKKNDAIETMRKYQRTYARAENFKLFTDCLIAEVSDIPAADVRPVWISVKERLPETCTFVLACFDDVQVIAFYGNYQWHEAFSDQVFYPTHWMPLPEFPKEAPA